MQISFAAVLFGILRKSGGLAAGIIIAMLWGSNGIRPFVEELRMSVWIIDGQEAITMTTTTMGALLYLTPEIDEFVNSPQHQYRIVVGTKGWGKTFLLLAKRRRLEARTKCIPAGALHDIPSAQANLSKDMCAFFSETSNWTLLWSASIVLSVFKNLGSEGEQKYLTSVQEALLLRVPRPIVTHPDVIQIINAPYLHTATQMAMALLTLNRQAILELQTLYTRVLLPVFLNVHANVAMFIDATDEAFRDYLYGAQGSAFGEGSPDIWYKSQIGLVKAISRLLTNTHVKVFATVRKEALQRASDRDEMLLQESARQLDLSYSYVDLKRLVLRYIAQELASNLVAGASNPFAAFFGLTEIVHSYVKGTTEHVFDYIYRHTLSRPRDFMAIGKSISAIEPGQRSPETIKIAVNLTAKAIASQYIKEVEPFMADVDLDRFFTIVPSNVLTKKDLKRLCGKLNDSLDCHAKKCVECDRTHVFCSLYNVGLLGVVERDELAGRNVQRFLHPGEAARNGKGLLPKSSYYLLHPVANDLIRDHNRGYQISLLQVIGDRQPWHSTDQTEITVFVTYSHKDRRLLSDESLLGYLKPLKNDGINIWHDAEVEDGDLWNETIREKIEAADIVLALVSQAFLASEYCQNVEMKRFLERRRKEGLRIIPLLLSPCEWNLHEWLSQTKFLATDEQKPLNEYRPEKKKAVFLEIASAIRKAAQTIRDRQTDG